MSRVQVVYPLEYCALHYLIQWERAEKAHHLKLRDTPTLLQLRKALRYFQVARNFSGLGEDKRAAKILRAYLEVRSEVSLTAEEMVTALADRFERDKFQYNLSAASKLLWLWARKPFILYDSRGVRALSRRFGHAVGAADYPKYCDAWKAEYQNHREGIDRAVHRLSEVRDFIPTWSMSNVALRRLSNAPWFKERVFDIFLWMAGDGA
jgi:hypothetical protein